MPILPGTWAVLLVAGTIGIAMGRRAANQQSGPSRPGGQNPITPTPPTPRPIQPSARPPPRRSPRPPPPPSARPASTTPPRPGPRSSSVTQAEPTEPSPRQHSLIDYPPSVQAYLPGVIIPQAALAPVAGRVFAPLPSVTFHTHGVPGVLLAHALRAPVPGLHDPDAVPRLSTTVTEVTLCIQWPGYDPWRAEGRVPLFDPARGDAPCTRQDLAQHVARLVQQFHLDMSCLQPGHALDWPLARIPFATLYLVELRNVARGCWQPVFCCAA
ncbi:hypothetical protein PsYK624_117290 [Phanerochaete sordida]|uniref:Uncharacterized protein n=1 Tax=Phanerochaete sordida TaxID=48140 RepID=A0A9P3GIH9_9APHY|nr:hypothetical protein PsYK624_117290 [Phanerochaete sordida]